MAGVPRRLADTGLYRDISSKNIDPRNLSYSPRFPLWSDGAQKHRWIRLPPGAAIDASDPDRWVFPPGTKVWKEFSFDGRRVETRLMQSSGGGRWTFATYAWNADESDAVLVPAAGLRGVVEIAPGKRHDIPGIMDCRACHEGNRVEVLGFSALQLAAGRDPRVPDAEPLAPGMVELDTLMRRGRIRSHPRAMGGAAAAHPGERLDHRSGPGLPARQLRQLPQRRQSPGVAGAPPASTRGPAERR